MICFFACTLEQWKPGWFRPAISRFWRNNNFSFPMEWELTPAGDTTFTKKYCIGIANVDTQATIDLINADASIIAFSVADRKNTLVSAIPSAIRTRISTFLINNNLPVPQLTDTIGSAWNAILATLSPKTMDDVIARMNVNSSINIP